MTRDPQRELRIWISERLKKAGRGARGRLATHLNLRPDAITRMLNVNPSKESRQISAHEILAIGDFFGETVGDDGASNIVEVPILSWVSAGQLMRADTHDDILGAERLVGLPPGDWIALIVSGDSMDRISPPESVILVNRSDTSLVANACYVIADREGNATYKRYRPTPMRFEPVSTNPAHETIFPEHDPTIVGRVRMTILRM